MGDHFFSNTKAICIVGLIFGVLNAGSAIYDLSNMKNSKDNVLSLIEKAKVGFFDVLFFFWNGYLGLEFLRSQNTLDIFFGIIIGIAVLSDIAICGTHRSQMRFTAVALRSKTAAKILV